MKKAAFKPPETLTKLILVSCPGSKVPIRSEANVEAELLRYANHGEKFEIYVKTVAGFYRIVGDKGYMNKSTKNVEWVDVKCQSCGCEISSSNYLKVNPIQVFKRKEIYCEVHYIKVYTIPGVVRLQAIVRGKFIRRRKLELRKERLHLKVLSKAAKMIQKIYRGYHIRYRYAHANHKIYRKLSSEMMKKLPSIVARQKQKSINYDSIVFNLYAEFPEFSKAQLDKYTELFNTYDLDKTGKLTVEGLARMMEKLKLPQTHLQLKMMIKEVDSDEDGMISLKDFITLFRKRAKGELMSTSSSQMVNIFNQSCNVREVGVGGAKAFFETKATFNKGNMALSEIETGKEQRAVVREEKAYKKESFESKRAAFAGKSSSS